VGASASFQSYVSSSNTDYATGGTAYTSGPFTFLPTGGFSNSYPANFAPQGGFVALHSMYVVGEITFGSTGGTISFDLDARIYGPDEAPPPAPEPTSMVIWGLGAGAIGLAGFWRRKRVAV